MTQSSDTLFRTTFLSRLRVEQKEKFDNGDFNVYDSEGKLDKSKTLKKKRKFYSKHAMEFDKIGKTEG